MSRNLSTDAGSEVKTGNHTTPTSDTLGIETLANLSSDEEPIVPRKRKIIKTDPMGSCNSTMTEPTFGTRSSQKVPHKRAGIGRQIHALKMRIEILQDDIKKYQKGIEERDIKLGKHIYQEDALRRKLNMQQHEIKEMRAKDKLYSELVSENNNLRSEIEDLKKMNQDYERNYSKLEKKYHRFKQAQLTNLNDQLKQRSPPTSVISAPIQAEEKELTEEEKFNRDLEAAIAASLAVNKPEIQEKSDQYLKQEIDFTLELSKKDDEIRKQKEHSLAFEQLFKKNVEAERAVKRKLVNMETEKEKVTKRLKVVEQEREKLVDEKEKLADELECTTLCGFCTENMKDAAFEPCGHIWACFTCIKTANISNCPTCREEIKNVRKVFIA